MKIIPLVESILGFSPDSKYIATGDKSGIVRLWNNCGQKIVEFQCLNDYLLGIKFSPDGRYIATEGNDDTVRLWTLNGEQIATFQGSNTIFSPDGKYIAVTELAYRVRLWRVESLNDLLKRGYAWLNNYFVTHPEIKAVLSNTDSNE